MKSYRPTLFIILLATLLCMSPERAVFATGDSQDWPRIGLALQGGGAKGFAHIGVLRWLEENHIPVEMIAGTSMGGLIGGLDTQPHMVHSSGADARTRR